MRIASWPNAISLLRFPLAVLFIVTESVAIRSVIALAAGISDWIDGWLARHSASRTPSGELIDPVADKTFVFAALFGLARTGELPVWGMLTLLARDLYVTAAYIVAAALGLRIRFRPRRSGKIVTALQIIAVIVLLLLPQWAVGIVVATGIAGLYAIVDYTLAGLRALRRGEAAP